MNICVFGAASRKIEKKYLDATYDLGVEIGKRGHSLVYGAGDSGVMGSVAQGAKKSGGKVVGIIPEFFREESIEPIFDGCDQVIYTKTMQDRLLNMENMADAFVIAPGGIGTMQEFFEVLTLKQLGRHKKPIAIFNCYGFYNTIEQFIYESMNKKFIRANCDLLYLTFTDFEEMFDYMEHQTDAFGMGVKDFK